MTIIIGDSHVAAMRYAAMALEGDEREAFESSVGLKNLKMLMQGKHFLAPFHVRGSDGVRLTNEAAIKATAAIFPDGVVKPGKGQELILCCGFHGVRTLNARKMWERFTLNPAVRSKHYLSAGAFEVIVKDLSAAILQFFDDLKAEGVAFRVLSSPPLPSNFFESDPPRGYSIEDGCAIDATYKRIFTEELRRRNIDYILPPSSVYDGVLLKPEFSRGDPGDHHGNPALGKVYLDHVLNS